MSKVIVCDIDGCLASLEHIGGWPEKKIKSGKWSYNKAYKKSVIYEPCAQYLRDAGNSFPIFMLTSREDSKGMRKFTRDFLLEHGIPYSELIMRAKGSEIHTSVMKMHALVYYVGVRNVLLLIDDNEDVLEMATTLGIKCYKVDQKNNNIQEYKSKFSVSLDPNSKIMKE